MDPIHGLWCQINSDAHHTIKHRLRPHSQGTCTFGHRVRGLISSYNRRGLHLVVGWVLSDQLIGRAHAYLMWLVVTRWYGEHVFGHDREQMMKWMKRRGVCGPSNGLLPWAWSMCVCESWTWWTGFGTCGQLSPRLAVISSNLVLCKWKMCNFIVGFRS